MRASVDAGDREHLGRVFAREAAAHRGHIVHAPGGNLVAMFDGPSRAVRCGHSVGAVAERSRIQVAAGVHVGECEPGATSGALIDMSAGIAAAAAPGEVLVSQTVVDLVPGSGLRFTGRDPVRLPGTPGRVPVKALAGSSL